MGSQELWLRFIAVRIGVTVCRLVYFRNGHCCGSRSRARLSRLELEVGEGIQAAIGTSRLSDSHAERDPLRPQARKALVERV